MLICASLALPFQMRQRNRSTCVMIIAFAAPRAGSSSDSTPATCFRCCSRMARWNQSSIGGAVTPASARMRRSPGQPSVKAVSAVSPVLPTAPRARRISAPMSVLTFATAPKTCRPPDSVSTLPIRTSRCHWPSSQLRMKVESKLTTIAFASTLTGASAVDVIDRVLAIWKVGDLEGMTAQRLRVLASVHREHLPEQGGCRPVGQQSRELRPQPIQLRSRAGVRRPLHACPGRAAASTAEAGQLDRDLSEQRGDRVLAIVLHAANALATPAPRPPHGVVPGLRSDNLPLDPRQHQLRFGQGQTQIGDVDEAIGPAILHDVRARPLAFRPDFHQPQNPSHVSTLGQRTSAEYPTADAPPISRRSP